MQMPDDPASLFVRDDAHLRDVCDRLRAAGSVAFDTEFIRERSYRPRICLVQVAGADLVALIDPFRVDLTPFWDLVLDESIEAVVHAGGQDLEICNLMTGRVPANVFDVQVAAGLVGLPYPLSYEKLVKQVAGVRIGKAETFSDWSQRPLTPGQLRYAVADVLYLPSVRERLGRGLDERGRMAWMREEMQRLEAEELYLRSAREAWLRVRRLGGLSRRQLAVIRELAEWREAAAEQADVPTRTLLRDEVLVGLARRMPAGVRDLHAIRGLPHPLVDRAGRDMLAAIRRGRESPEPGWPDAADTREGGPAERMLADLAAVAGQGLCLAGEVAPGLLAARADYEEVAEWVAQGGKEAESAPRLLRGWRGEFAGRTIEAVLAGRAALRLTGPPDAPRLDVE
ncbi:MAG TPA: HRDC domain-containing protein [Phycisphaerae bacterium]|nr:HRDC domain-containing protein [Phycisphaerae bacterium]